MLRWPSRYVPIYLYQDALVGIIPKRNLNNGQPWLHALLIAAAAPRPGEHVAHIGAGVGYYTAILAHMVGESGRVMAIEFDSGLTERLAANFAGQPNVRALQGDGAQIAFDPADVIYVNAGATPPAGMAILASWIFLRASNRRSVSASAASGISVRRASRLLAFITSKAVVSAVRPTTRSISRVASKTTACGTSSHNTSSVIPNFTRLLSHHRDSGLPD
jgi:hypothetical protein